MWQDDLADAQHLISPFFGVKFLYDFGLWWVVRGCEIGVFVSSLPLPRRQLQKVLLYSKGDSQYTYVPQQITDLRSQNNTHRKKC